MGNNMNDNIDQRMTAWLSSVSQGCSEDIRFSLLSSALEAFLERFEQENGPISAIGRLSVNDNTCHEAQPDTDVQSREQESDTTSCTARDDHVTVSDTDSPQTHIAEVGESSMLVSESELSLSSQANKGVPGTLSTVLSGESSEIGTGDKQQSEKRLKRKRKHHAHMHDQHSTTKKARLDFNDNNSSLDTPSCQDLNNNCTSLDAPANHDCNNNYSSLDARLEQFFVCAQTNCLIPKQANYTNINSPTSTSDIAEHSLSKARHREEKVRHREERERRREERKMRREEKARRREERARRREDRASHREDKAKHICDNIKPVQEKPRLRGHKKERSLLKVATIRCLVRKAFQTGTYCCYRRCFLNRPRIYV